MILNQANQRSSMIQFETFILYRSHLWNHLKWITMFLFHIRHVSIFKKIWNMILQIKCTPGVWIFHTNTTKCNNVNYCDMMSINNILKKNCHLFLYAINFKPETHLILIWFFFLLKNFHLNSTSHILLLNTKVEMYVLSTKSVDCQKKIWPHGKNVWNNWNLSIYMYIKVL